MTCNKNEDGWQHRGGSVAQAIMVVDRKMTATAEAATVDPCKCIPEQKHLSDPTTNKNILFLVAFNIINLSLSSITSLSGNPPLISCATEFPML